MEKISIHKKIEYMIDNADIGSVFVTSDFADIASNNSVNRTLLRLVACGKLRTVLRGVYEKPNFNDFLKEYVAPSPQKVAHAIARNYGWNIVPSGDTALNELGLSTQVTATWLYVSDGPYRSYSFDKTSIIFKHTTNRDISQFSYVTSLVIQALKALGKDNITDVVIDKFRRVLATDEKQQMIKEAKPATSWIYEVIKKIN
jgi:hypothetical protein